MTTLKKISVFVLFCSTASPAWSAIYDFCKIKKVYDENVAVAPKTIYEDCPGIGYMVNGKDLAKANCWKDASDLQEGKCQIPTNTSADSRVNTQIDIPLE